MVHLVIQKAPLQRVMSHGGVCVLVMSEGEQVDEEHMFFVWGHASRHGQ